MIPQGFLVLFAVAFFLVFTATAVFLRRLFSRIRAGHEGNEATLPDLLPWKTKAFADLAWNTSYVSTSIGRETRERRLILSLHEWERLPEAPEAVDCVVAGQEALGRQDHLPPAAWLACELVTTVRFLSASRMLHLQSSKHKVTLDAPVNFRLGSTSQARIAVAGGMSGQFRYEDNSLVLSREGSASPVGSWDIGDNAQYSSKTPYYGAVEIQGHKVASMLTPGAYTPYFFKSQKTPQLLLQEVSPHLTEEQGQLLLAFVAIQIYSLMLRTEELQN